MSKRTNKVVFKAYTPNQILLLPPSLDEKITEHHPVRVVSQVIDSINITALEKKTIRLSDDYTDKNHDYIDKISEIILYYLCNRCRRHISILIYLIQLV